MKTIDFLGMDYGASNGRGVVGKFDGNKLSLDVVHRFTNNSIPVFGNHYWDILYLYNQAVESIKRAGSAGYHLRSMGIDSWALDYGLLNCKGRMLDGVHSHRDSRTNGMIGKGRNKFSDQELFEITGLPPTEIATLYQLLAAQQQDPELLNSAETLLFVPNLLAYLLTGCKCCDSTIASTSMLYDLRNRAWAESILQRCQLPSILPAIARHGEVIDTLSTALSTAEQIDSIPVICVANHDTASAFSSVPARDKERVVTISCGTWSVVGCGVLQFAADPAARSYGFCYEMGYRDQILLVKNLTGLFILQQCMREWALQGYEADYRKLSDAARECEYDASIDVSAQEFAEPGNMNGKIIAHCLQRGITPPRSREEVYRCVVSGLIQKYEETIRMLEELTQTSFGCIHLIGGGAQDTYLCDTLCRRLHRQVIAGPYEATVIGNLFAQLAAQGEVRDTVEFADVLDRSFGLTRYN